MKISSVRVRRIDMPRVDPAWRTALYAGTAVEGFVLEIAAGDVVGIGSTAAHVTQILGDDLQLQIEGAVREALLGADVLAGNKIRETLRNAPIHARAVLAADLALHDLLGKLANLPCYALWGGLVHDEVTVVRMVGIKPPAALETAVRAFMDQGYTHFKIKVGTGVGEDVERIKTLRSAFGSSIWIGIDGNDAYSPEDAIELSHRLEPFDIGVIEQPVDYRDLDGLARVTAASQIPIMADQCVEDVASALAVCRRQAAHMVSLKLVKTGTVDEFRRVAELCQAFGVRAHVGGSVAPMGVDAAQAQLAASIPGIEEECEVGEHLAVTGDLLHGLRIENGRIKLSTAPGLGVELTSVPAPS